MPPALLHRPRWIVALGLTLAAGLYARAQATDFTDLSLDELAHYDVTTLGRKDASVFDTPAPVDVISGTEIVDSGALTMPEALRLAAGVQVTQVDGENYTIAIRGFDDATSSKVLVLLDGRSVYDQLYSGTDWALLDTVMDDISRIEVQRGPAGALWGANAVNGVINIVTKNAHATQGQLVSVEIGDQLDESVTVRDGFEFSPALAARVYAKFQQQGSYDADEYGTGIRDWNSRLAGTRIDWDRPGGGGLTVIGEYREVRADDSESLPSLTAPYSQTYTEQTRDRSADLSAHWTQPVTDDGQLSILGAVERGDIDSITTGEHHTVLDLDSQVTLHPFPNNEVITGATYRATMDSIVNTPWLAYDDPAATTNFYGAFVQDEVTLVPDVLRVTAGSKFERNTFTGWETQPSLRLLWHPSKAQSVWFAVSKAARTPSRAERGVRLWAETEAPTPEVPVPVVVEAIGDSHFTSEHVLSYELGHRYDIGTQFSVDTSLYYSDYTDLRGLEAAVIPPNFLTYPPYAVIEYDATNNLEGHSYGGEISLRWHPAPNLQVAASADSVHLELSQMMPTLLPDPSIPGLIGSTPPEEFKLHVTWRPWEPWTFDIVARHTGPLALGDIPAYDGLNLRVAWKIVPDVELEVVGRDLLKPTHLEGTSSIVTPVALPIARSYFIGVTYRH
ncbi:MAG TPA: TonB-dependent receptor [Opitutaceae bacterium]|jgi:iron complex outermembrane receptor protein|nr:TonB-dependent receptor [Opitutaceae bacterium]